MKTITKTLPFTDKTQWSWPDEDEKLLQVFDHVSDIDYFMQFVDKTDLVIQAGGACGVWPLRYSQLFDEVFTFEPMAANFECLRENIKDIWNIVPIPSGLSDREEKGDMVFDRTEHNNYGAVYFKPGNGGVGVGTIDSHDLSPDLIQLDIEGYELEALQGSVETIERSSPVIALEEKRLNHQPRDHFAARNFIAQMGYKEVGAIHRDVVFKRI